MPQPVMRYLGLKSDLIQHLLKLGGKNRSYRHSKQTCVVTGTKLVKDLGRRFHFQQLLCSTADHPDLEGLQYDELHLAEPRVLKRLARVHDFDGLIATLPLPEKLSTWKDLQPRLVLCLEYVEDPHVLGTLLRTAMAFQWQAVYFLKYCADPWDGRCIRSSQGALLDLPYCKGDFQDLLKFCKQKRLMLVTPHHRGESLEDLADQRGVDQSIGFALLLREEYAAPFAPPKDAVKIQVPDPWENHPLEDGDAFDMRALDTVIQGGILMHQLGGMLKSSEATLDVKRGD